MKYITQNWRNVGAEENRGFYFMTNLCFVWRRDQESLELECMYETSCNKNWEDIWMVLIYFLDKYIGVL